MKFELPRSAKNWISLIGATIAIIVLFMMIFLFVIATFFSGQPIYLGIIIYMLLPAVLILGLILIPVGMLLNRKKISKTQNSLPFIDLNLKRHRNAVTLFVLGTAIFFLLSAIGSYEAFHYTESVEFCGTLCHEVMKPEYDAYQHSSHARVACAECHIGAGADWFVKAKISGLHQVISVLTNEYSKPIPTPIANLRPARETCEQCHWPQKFYANKQRLERHYLNDEENSEWDIYLNMKLGSQLSARSFDEGIHWHINPDVKIEYISTHEQKENISWVRYTNLKTGDVTIYNNEEDTLDEEQIQEFDISLMDCMDCHNRPAHSYKPPAFFINEAITAGIIPIELPEIKSLAMQICAEEFSTTDSARQYIEKTVIEFYEEDYPEIAESKMKMIKQAVKGIQDKFVVNIFPEMNVKWDAYPNHIGHLEFDGCFRCHDDQHVSEDDKAISRDCNICHTIKAQGPPEDLEMATITGFIDFRHPGGEIEEDEWMDTNCTECHTGLDP
ncbi:MAG: cytochrome C [Calditrichaeota bacterium]|nr:MAG: cytochrome C [Calditrichota bacterium]MBL1206241.1 cytochrome C [Calditrichota bacterium]NOG46067.1 cytochrome C [Calditrichota bacterium]